MEQHCCCDAICECFLMCMCVCMPSLLSVLDFLLASHLGFFPFLLLFFSVFLFICHYLLLFLLLLGCRFFPFRLISFLHRFLLLLLLYNALKMSKDLCAAMALTTVLLLQFSHSTNVFVSLVVAGCTSSHTAYTFLLTLYRNKSQHQSCIHSILF